MDRRMLIGLAGIGLLLAVAWVAPCAKSHAPPAAEPPAAETELVAPDGHTPPADAEPQTAAKREPR